MKKNPWSISYNAPKNTTAYVTNTVSTYSGTHNSHSVTVLQKYHASQIKKLFFNQNV